MNKKEKGVIKLYKPKIEDLWFREEMLNDPETMSYNNSYGGTISFPKEKWNNWYSSWVNTDEHERFYRYLSNDNNEFVGEVCYHYDDNFKAHMVDIIIYSKFRKRGYAKEGLQLIMEKAKENGIKVLCDNVAVDNPAIQLFINLGFEETYKTDEFIMIKTIIN